MSTPSAALEYARIARRADDDKRLKLRQMKWIATGLLLLVTALYALSQVLKARHPAWPYVGAFAEAAMVGALADWFAVSALFRHPLGLSFIPHTAIIPKNKDRIADNLGQFVQGEFFASERVTGYIAALTPAARLARWLADEHNSAQLGRYAASAFGYALSALDSAAVRAFLKRNVIARFNQLDLAEFAGNILDALTQNGRHQAIFDQALGTANTYLNDDRVKLPLIEMLAGQIPLGFDSLKNVSARYVYGRLIDGFANTLADMEGNPGHPLRQEFDRVLQQLIDKLRADPAFRERVRQYQHEWSADPVLADYVDSLWNDLHAWLKRDLADPDSQIQHQIAGLFRQLGQSLEQDAAMQQWIDGQILQHTPHALDRLRPRISSFISTKMKEWQDHEIVDKLELNIGRDLQFIRFNGTLVGGFVGLAIHAATVLLL